MEEDAEFVKGNEAPIVVNFDAIIEEGYKVSLNEEELEKIDAGKGDMVNVSLRKIEDENSEVGDDGSGDQG